MYETVRLPASKFDQHEQIRIPHKKTVKPKDEFYYESSRNYLVRENPGRYQLHFKVYRTSGNELLGKSIAYAGRGGDMPEP